jgi:NAD(P)-dependent dehydrogenase (short-subunit alcohol dehydrogenase family)
LRFAVNYLAGFLLIRLLLPTLLASAPAKIVQVSSAGQAPIDFDDVMLTRSYGSGQAYCQSKLAQIMFTFDLAELQPRRSGPCRHPGWPSAAAATAGPARTRNCADRLMMSIVSTDR